VLERCNDPLLILVLLARQTEYLSDLPQAGDNLLVRFCSDPAHGAVLQAMPVSVLQGNLRLADSSQPLQGI
jgi:hypothetical protein